MPTINFGPWVPDQPSFGNTCIIAQNVYPVRGGYEPFSGINAVSDALVAAPLGCISFRRTTGARETFVGTLANLYRLNGTTWTDVTNAGGFSNATFWRFAIYGERLIATNGIDNPQAFDLASDSVFADLPNAPVHRYPIVIRDTLVAVDVQDGSGKQVKWSAVNDSEDWTATSGGGEQSFPDGGPIVGGTGGEFGVILQDSGLTRMTFVGGDLRFTFDKIEGSIGCSDANSIVAYKGITFYLSEEGFQSFDGAESVNISDEQISDAFFNEFGANRVTDTNETRVTSTAETRIINKGDVVRGALDTRKSCVTWSYPAAGVNKIIIFNYRLNQWSEATQEVACLHASLQTTGPILAGFDATHKLSLFNGTALTAVLSTGDLQLFPDRRAGLSSARGLIDAAHDITVTKKGALSDAGSTVVGSSNTNGKCSIRADARYMRFSLSQTAVFTEITGIEVEARPSGRAV